MVTEIIKPLKERDDFDLLELVCQLHSRALNYPTREMHDSYIEARAELEWRLRGYNVQLKINKNEN